ncbi:hypothetical protein RJ55_02126 [Drechmeria coniospora]|nr:hypothetical protein RJ55_02126 [Drechmeria coniospora]
MNAKVARRDCRLAVTTPYSRGLTNSPSHDSVADGGRSVEDMERVVRDAKQRFRDTLPKNYLDEQEYALYERLYGPPLRETAPEDVGIPMHAEPGSAIKGTVLRPLDHGELDHVASTTAHEAAIVGPAPGYVDMVARSQREHDALQRLANDFEAAQRNRQPTEDEVAHAGEADGTEETTVPDWLEPEPDEGRRLSGEARRFHEYTLKGRFHGSPVELTLPRAELTDPIRELLDRSHLKHVKEAAEAAFGGRGLPTSPATPESVRNGRMGGVGLAPDQRHMTEIEADAFIASYLPPAYATVMSVLREVRRRAGRRWIQPRLKQGGLSVLDAGAGGAGLIAWEQIVRAEWDVLKEAGEVSGQPPQGKKTVIAASDRLRHRIKTFLDDTTFLPRLPDYEHSGDMRGQHIDAGDQRQSRKTFDVIIASHLFLKEKQDHYRQAVLNNLWSLLSKDGGVLVVVEKAHPRGFEAVAHVRDTVLNHFLLPPSGQSRVGIDDFNPAFHRELEAGQILAPCTSHGSCPMYVEEGKSKGRKDYCHFHQRFARPKFYSAMLGASAGTQGDVEFSYVTFQRGVAKAGSLSGAEATAKALEGYEMSSEGPDMKSLPRVVLPPLKRKGHVTLDVCTPEGKMERWTVPKSFSKLAYHDARKSQWGDLWALGAKTRVPRNVRLGSGAEEGKKRAADDKKPRRVEIAMDGGRIPAKDRKPKSKEAKKRDLMRDLFAAEAVEERLIEREMDEEDVSEAAVEGGRDVAGR